MAKPVRTQIVLMAGALTVLFGLQSLAVEPVKLRSPEGSAKSKDRAPEAKKSGASASKQKARPAGPSKSVRLVPPPPPISPSALDYQLAMPLGLSFDLMSEKDLKEKRINLEKRVEILKAELEDREREVGEKKERALLFESLYKEGVVSRRELEGAGKEASFMERELAANKDELADLTRTLAAVKKRLEFAAPGKQKERGAPREKDTKAPIAGGKAGSQVVR